MGRRHLPNLRIGFQRKAPFLCHQRAVTGGGTGLPSTPSTQHGHRSPCIPLAVPRPKPGHRDTR